MTLKQHYDLIIIGAGAGGGTLAYALASTGKNILILERGGYLPREKSNWNPDEIFLNQRYQTPEKWFDSNNQSFSPEAFYFVGGNTKVYGAALQRMRAEDFGELRHFDGISPAWPLGYDTFEPYYTRAESLFKLHGLRGEDPTEPPATNEYPFPPFNHEPRIQEVADKLQNLGLNPYHLTLALNRDEEHPENRPCIRCNTCDPYPCLVDAKCDAQVTCIDPALQQNNVTLLTHAKVTRLITNNDGKIIQAVEAEIDGETQQFSSDLVVLSCGAINSATLLLKSANSYHPNGLANSSGLVGRNLMLHNHSALIAASHQPNETIFQKTLGINDFYFKGPKQDYPLGQIQLTGKTVWQRLKHMAEGEIPQAVLEYIAQHSVDWWITTEDLPQPENHVTLNSQGQIVVNYTPNNLKPHQELIATLEQYLKQLDFYLFWTKKMPVKVVWHQGGTCKFGNDPQESVLNLNCQTHDVNNLYVVDSSFFPALGAVNPTLTIVANALRVADHLKNKWG
jgi:choline dehydrogenase-like flavoprotein